MTKEFKLKVCFWLSFLMLSIFSLTFLIMPCTISIEKKIQNAILILISIVFWCCLIVGLVLLFFSYHLEKIIRMEESGDNPKRKKIPFFTNIPTAIADICFLTSIIVLFVIWNQNNINRYMTYVVISILFESLFVQLLFCGNTYRKIRSIK